ncbi:MAG TPA: nucleotide sugar dehydrogenase [bacterium]
MTDPSARATDSRTVPQPVGVVGLGYVGLQLAVAFGRHVPTVGFDIDARRVQALQEGRDWSGEVDGAVLRSARRLTLTFDPAALRGLGVYIVAVPTPVDAARRPDLGPLIAASELVGEALRDGGRDGIRPIVVFESTVYPGCTEEVCVPVIERASDLTAGEGFAVGYSPERINPGDAEHTLQRIVKVVAGQDRDTTAALARLYGAVVDAGVYEAPDIRTAEAAKVIENVQRDLNIALMNELSLLFHRLGLDTQEVLAAARTKWNFLPFEPGLVGGHCIPVDPYYLTHKAQEAGFIPDVILAGRRTNDSMGSYVGRETVRLLIRAGRIVRGARVLILGVTFKENVKDTRNTKVADIVRELEAHDLTVAVYDPLVAPADIARLGLLPAADDPFAGGEQYDAVILAVAHRVFCDRPAADFARLIRSDDGSGVFIDIKGVLPEMVRRRVLYWRL